MEYASEFDGISMKMKSHGQLKSMLLYHVQHKMN